MTETATLGSNDAAVREPYKGLRPYEESDQDLFFGRDDERDVLIDKVLTNRLTLLFAATGVGKTSLLQAAVLPSLKDPRHENLDVVVYNDWVSPPLEGLKQKTLDVLKERGHLAPECGVGVGSAGQHGGGGALDQRPRDREVEHSAQGNRRSGANRRLRSQGSCVRCLSRQLGDSHRQGVRGCYSAGAGI